jgi:hypothetical protein
VRAVFFTGSVASVEAPVGAQARVVIEAGYALRHRWQLGARFGVERLSLDDNADVSTHVAGVASRVDAGRVTMVADLEIIDTYGVGYQTSLSLGSRVRGGPAQLIGTVRIDGDRYVGAGVALFARLDRRLALLAGYDDGTESMRAAVVIDVRGIEVATGVFEHPVLGMSQTMSIACFR